MIVRWVNFPVLFIMCIVFVKLGGRWSDVDVKLGGRWSDVVD